MGRSANVVAVVVAYKPDPMRFDTILATLAQQCRFVVVDNAEDLARSGQTRDSVARHGGTHVPMGGNLGIAAAQNAGIDVAWRLGADDVLLLDDDSIPHDDLLSRLLEGRDRLAAIGSIVVCAAAVDREGRDISNVRGQRGEAPRCRDMMSSGSLIPRSVFERVGPFETGMFIDCVDFEWGWRASRAGVGIRVWRRAVIQHQLGEGRAGVLKVPAPIRHYYQFRNILNLMTRSYVPLAWRAQQAVKLPVKLLLIALTMKDRAPRLRFAAAGIHDAWAGRTGRWRSSSDHER